MKSIKHEFVSSKNKSREALGIREVGQNKLKLELRQLRFEAELKTMQYPKDLRSAIEYQLSLRAETLENKYKQVFAFTLLQRFGSFWHDFGCKSLDEWLAVVDLPSGSTLANREVMVRVFSKETFVLIGDDMLGEMMYIVSRVQNDSEKRKADYQNIFNNYCKSYTSFDKSKFREILNLYINTKYIAPINKNIEDVKARPPKLTPKGSTSAKVAKFVNKTTNSIDGSSINSELDFVIQERICSGCKTRDTYISKLESIIIKNLGDKFLPEKPEY